MNNRKLLDYLPPFIQEYKEIRAILNDGQQVEIESVWEGIDSVRNEQFIESLDDWGCSKWEGMLQIQPKQADTLEERRFRILAYINAQLPYTLRQLKNMLTTLCGSDGYQVMLFHNEYNLIVKLSLDNESNYNAVNDMLKIICPANLTLNVYMFNVHGVIRKLTHGQMRPYTHTQLRTEML